MKYIDTQTYNILCAQENPRAAEKDYLECTLLALLFSDQHLLNQCVFAGGASVAKSHGLSYRICQDLDLACCNFYDIPESRSKRQLNIYKHQFKEFVFDTILADVRYLLRQDGHFHVVTDRELFPGKQSDPVLHVLCKSDLDNSTIQICIELIPRKYPSDKIVYLPVVPYSTDIPMGHIPTVIPQQTFWDKIYALHTNTQLTVPCINNNFSRHYYDIVQMAPAIDMPATKHMLFDIAHRQSIYTTRNLPTLRQTADVRMIPNNATLSGLEQDYELIIPTCRIQPPAWKDIVLALKKINLKINSL